MREVFFHFVQLEELMHNLNRFARIVQLLLCLMEVGRKVRARVGAEVAGNPLALSQSLDVWVLLSACLQVDGHEVLSTLGVLVQRKVEESLLLVEVSTALRVFKREGCQHIF